MGNGVQLSSDDDDDGDPIIGGVVVKIGGIGVSSCHVERVVVEPVSVCGMVALVLMERSQVFVVMVYQMESPYNRNNGQTKTLNTDKTDHRTVYRVVWVMVYSCLLMTMATRSSGESLAVKIGGIGVWFVVSMLMSTWS